MISRKIMILLALLLGLGTAVPLVSLTSASVDCAEPDVVRVAGSDRVATAVAMSQRLWETADAVVLASAADFPDALAAGVLAVRLDAPLLLTPPESLDDAVAAELQRLDTVRVLVSGGPAAISPDVTENLTQAGYQVERVAGEDRYATAAALAELATGDNAQIVALATGEDFPDALAAAALAGTPDHIPVLLTGRDQLHPEAAEALDSLDATDVLMIGGTSAISASVTEDLEASGYRVNRLAGADRYATGAAVLDHALSRSQPGGVVAASGGAFPDALAAGPAAARAGAVLAIVPPADLTNAPALIDVLDHSPHELRCNLVAGGPAAVSDDVVEQLRELLLRDGEPEPVPTESVVLIAAGDIADCNEEGDEATAGLLDDLVAANDAAVATLGDNAYERGTHEEFANCYDPTWGRHKDVTFPSLGNHEYGTPDAAGYFDYFGEVAGPPGQGWYSYDLGAWHVVVLNSECGHVEGGCDEGSPQEQWLRADLAAARTGNILAYWHQPRWSSGRHGNDDDYDAFWDALYEFGADLVLVGHDHNYERLAPLAPDGVIDDDRGIRQFVVGTGGRELRAFDGPPLAATEVRDDQTWGVLVLTLRTDGYDWEFVPVAGGTFTDSGSATVR